MNKIISVCKTHFDIGFTGLFSEIMQEYKEKMLSALIQTCRKTESLAEEKRFRWTMPSWPLLKTLDAADGQEKEQAEKLIRSGELVAHALPFTIHTEFFGEAELNRLFMFSKEFCDRYDLTYPISAKMTDVPGHTWILPSVLAKAGVKFMHIGCNPGSHPADLPTVFWWMGPDGGKVLTIYSKGQYGTDLVPPSDWPLPVWIWLCVTNDNIGPQSAEDLVRYEDAVKKQYGDDCLFELGTMDDFYNEIAKYDLSFLPVIKTDIADSWIHGIMSYPKETSLIRRNRRLLTAVEKYMNFCGGTDEESRKAFYRAYEQAILYGEHTMGLNVIVDLAYDRKYDKESFTRMRRQENYRRMEASWNEQTERCALLLAETEKLYGKVSAKKGTCFNPSAKEFFGLVKVDGNPFFTEGKNALRLGDSLYAEARIPGLGSVPAEEFERPKRCSISENDLYIELKSESAYVRISKASGAVTEFYDNQTRKNYALCLGKYQYDIADYGEICEYLKEYAYYFYDWVVTAHGRMAYPETFTHFTDVAKCIKAEEYFGGVLVTMTPQDAKSISEYGNAEKIQVFYYLYENRLHIDVKVVGKQATPMVEALHFNFNFNFEDPVYTINKVGCCVDPEKDIVFGANNILYCMENYVDISDGKNALALVSHDAPLFSIGEQSLYKYSPEYKKRSDCRICVNLTNTMWGTNFPQWIEGDFSYSFDLIPHDAGRFCDKEIAALVYPPLFVDGPSGKIMLQGAELIDCKSISDTSYVLRVKRNSASNGRAMLSVGCPEVCFAECDFYDRIILGLPSENGTVEFDLNGYETKSILVKKGKNGGSNR